MNRIVFKNVNDIDFSKVNHHVLRDVFKAGEPPLNMQFQLCGELESDGDKLGKWCIHWLDMDGKLVDNFIYDTEERYNGDVKYLNKVSCENSVEHIILDKIMPWKVCLITNRELAIFFEGDQPIVNKFVLRGLISGDQFKKVWGIDCLDMENNHEETFIYTSEENYLEDIEYLRALAKLKTIDAMIKNDRERLTIALGKLQEAWQEAAKVVDKVDLPDAYSEKYPFADDLGELIVPLNTWVNAVKYCDETPAKEPEKVVLFADVNFKQLTEVDWSKVDDIYFYPVIAYDKDDKPLTIKEIERCDYVEKASEDDPKTTMFSVYYSMGDKDNQCIGDFKTEKQAVEFKDFILKKFATNVKHDVNLTLHFKAQQNIDIPDLIDNVKRLLSNSLSITDPTESFEIKQQD